MKHLLFLLTLAWALPTLVGAQTVAEDILKGSQIQGIEFKNYVGPHKVIETRLAIQGIGADLGRQMKVPGALKADYAGKYQIQRIHDPASPLLSADVLILGPDAGVDHIRNLNWIVSAYLQQAFGYSVTDADLLANFVTRYNAFYRGKVDYVKATYIPAVGEAVTAETLGLSTVWSEWAGKTRMLIPLRDSLSKGLAGSLNTEEVSNKDIVTQMAQDPGKGLDDRKKLADLKEGEIVQEQKAVAQAEAKSPAVPSGTGTTAAGPTTTAPTLPGSTAAPATNPPTATSGPAATPSPTPTPTLPLDQAKQQLAARDQALQTERQDIVKQENKTPAPTPTPTPAPVKPASTAAFVRMNDGSKTGQLWLIDPVANAVWKKSELNTIRTTDAPAFGTGYLVIAGDTKGANGAVRLVLLSKDDGSVLLTGTDDISPDSPLLVSGTQVLALTKGTSGWVLGSFDPTLKSLAKGTDSLSSLTAVVPTANGILVQAASGQILLLDPATLKKKSATGG
jgi:hypothetical protein